MFKIQIQAAFGVALLLTFGHALADQSSQLDSILEARSDEAKARDIYRHPKETLELFGIKPGMTVIDALPGAWYGDIIAPLIGEEGTYIGVRYGQWYYQHRYGENSAEQWEKAQTGLSEWVDTAKQYGSGENIPEIAAHFIPGLPTSLNNQVDAVLLFRALHHIHKYDSKYLHQTVADAFRVVKPGGIVGVVQHRAPEHLDDDWANGNNGYIKQSLVIETFKAAGFELDNVSEINANRKDQPTVEDKVWRLPPSNKDDEMAQQIGESDRMTLVFRKP